MVVAGGAEEDVESAGSVVVWTADVVVSVADVVAAVDVPSAVDEVFVLHRLGARRTGRSMETLALGSMTASATWRTRACVRSIFLFCRMWPALDETAQRRRVRVSGMWASIFEGGECSEGCG